MAQKLQTELSLIEWCDQQVRDGHELSMGWEGGGDSGWCWFNLDDQQMHEDDNPQVRKLLDLMYDTLDYGSWAGEFSAQGKATYDTEKKAFVGEDLYSEDETVTYDCNLTIRIPKRFWFDTFHVSIEDDNAIVDALFIIKNGFLTPQHDEWLQEFKEQFDKEVDEVITAFKNDPNQKEYNRMWEEIILERNEFHEEGDFLVYHLKTLDIGAYSQDIKDIYLQLENVDTDEE